MSQHNDPAPLLRQMRNRISLIRQQLYDLGKANKTLQERAWGIRQDLSGIGRDLQDIEHIIYSEDSEVEQPHTETRPNVGSPQPTGIP